MKGVYHSLNLELWAECGKKNFVVYFNALFRHSRREYDYSECGGRSATDTPSIVYPYSPLKGWMPKQHLELWREPCGTQRQARELISGPNLSIGARLLSFNRTQSRVVIGLLTGHNTLWRHLHVMGLSNYPTCRKCGTEEETSVHVLCECEALVSLRHRYLGTFFLNPEDIRLLRAGAIWNFAKGTRLL
jgi:hypothetical protein